MSLWIGVYGQEQWGRSKRGREPASSPPRPQCPRATELPRGKEGTFEMASLTLHFTRKRKELRFLDVPNVTQRLRQSWDENSSARCLYVKSCPRLALQPARPPCDPAQILKTARDFLVTLLFFFKAHPLCLGLVHFACGPRLLFFLWGPRRPRGWAPPSYTADNRMGGSGCSFPQKIAISLFFKASATKLFEPNTFLFERSQETIFMFVITCKISRICRGLGKFAQAGTECRRQHIHL